jgi:general secretion pathway protein G
MKITIRRGKSAFTLIEILAVMAIIAILAGVIVGSTSLVRDKQDRELTKVQIGIISNKLEEYKLDTGAYPATENNETGEKTSDVIFKALYWDSDDDDKGVGTGQEEGDLDQKIYLPDLDPATSKQKWTKTPASDKTKILDPWGQEYRYRSAKDENGKENSSTDNPDFDLWSIGKDGKSKPGTPKDKVNGDDIKNS